MPLTLKINSIKNTKQTQKHQPRYVQVRPRIRRNSSLVTLYYLWGRG